MRPVSRLCVPLLGALAAGVPPFASPASPSSPAPASAPPLVLNGEAVRTAWGMGVYRASLYLCRPMRTSGEVLSSGACPKLLRITMLRSVDSGSFSAAVRRGIDANFSPRERGKFGPQLAEFLSCFGGGSSLSGKSVVEIAYDPGSGMEVRLDGRPCASIPGPDFCHAILRLWLLNPAQESIREGLLGGTAP